MAFDPSDFSQMFEQQRRFFENLQKAMAPQTEWITKMGQQVLGVEQTVLDNLSRSREAVEAAMADHVKAMKDFEAAAGPQMKKAQDAATAAMAPQLDAIKAASAPMFEWMQQAEQAWTSQMKVFGDAMESAAKAWGLPELKSEKD